MVIGKRGRKRRSEYDKKINTRGGGWYLINSLSF